VFTVFKDKIPMDVVGICTTLKNCGHKSWIVGGSIRDLFMGKTPHDWDLATTALPDEILRIFPKCIPTGLKHGTVTVVINDTCFEITTLRSEGESSSHRAPDSTTFITSIEEDLARRDFTMNAIAFDPLRDTFVDPFGGEIDIKNKVIRAVGDPDKRFEEDNLRVLRAIRFSTILGFAIEGNTASSISTVVPTFSTAVSKERIIGELTKIFESAETPSIALELVKQHGLLPLICAPLVNTIGCVQNKFHKFDVWNHTIRCVDEISKGKTILRFAALLHDVGKPGVREINEKTGQFCFHGHEDASATIADAWLQEFKFSTKDKEKIVHLVQNHFINFGNRWSKSATRRFIKRVGIGNLNDLFSLNKADWNSKGVESEGITNLENFIERVNEVLDTTTTQSLALEIKDLAINGNDVMTTCGIKQGKQVGVILNGLLEQVLDNPEFNERETLLNLIKNS